MTSPPRHPGQRPAPCRRTQRLLPAALLAAAALTGDLPAAVAGSAVQIAQDAGANEEAPRFFAELDDLPLMAGLQEMTEAGVAFDKPGGRIGEAYAEGAVPAEQVRTFYAATLPELGWKPVAEGRYRRGGEELELEISEAPGVTTLRLSLSPAD